MGPETTDLLFTIAASFALIVLLVSAALVLPWTEEELDETEKALRQLVRRRAVVHTRTSVNKPAALASYAPVAGGLNECKLG